jgi:hypothetical protein
MGQGPEKTPVWFKDSLLSSLIPILTPAFLKAFLLGVGVLQFEMLNLLGLE